MRGSSEAAILLSKSDMSCWLRWVLPDFGKPEIKMSWEGSVSGEAPVATCYGGVGCYYTPACLIDNASAVVGEGAMRAQPRRSLTRNAGLGRMRKDCVKERDAQHVARLACPCPAF